MFLEFSTTKSMFVPDKKIFVQYVCLVEQERRKPVKMR